MIILICLLALVLRLISLNQSLWLDEAINVNVARALSYKDLIFHYSLSDFHPPLYHIILKTWILAFGSSEISVRMPSVIFGVGTVFVVFLAAKKLFEKKTAFIAATLIATAPLHIYYSQEARMYMMAAFFASLSVYFFVSIIKKDTFLNWLGFVIATAAALYSDYLVYLLLPAYCLFIAFNFKRILTSTLRTFIPALVLIFALLAPWFTLLPKQLSGGLTTAVVSPAWAQVVGSPTAKSLGLVFIKFSIGRISNPDKNLYALLFAPVGLYMAFLFFVSLFRVSHLRSILWYWLLVPIVLGFAISFYVPVFAYFRLIFTLGAFYIILASAINSINWPPFSRLLLFLALAINLGASTIYLTNPSFQRENWRQAVNYIGENFTPRSIVLFESNYTTGPFDYYNVKNLKAAGALDNFIAQEPSVTQKVESLTHDKNKIFLFQYLSQITDPQGLVFQAISKEGFVNSSTKDFTGVGFVYEFNR